MYVEIRILLRGAVRKPGQGHEISHRWEFVSNVLPCRREVDRQCGNLRPDTDFLPTSPKKYVPERRNPKWESKLSTVKINWNRINQRGEKIHSNLVTSKFPFLFLRKHSKTSLHNNEPEGSPTLSHPACFIPCANWDVWMGASEERDLCADHWSHFILVGDVDQACISALSPPRELFPRKPFSGSPVISETACTVRTHKKPWKTLFPNNMVWEGDQLRAILLFIWLWLVLQIRV